MVLVREIIQRIESLAPPTLAEDWDNSGPQTGNPNAEVNRILVALTPLPEVLDEAEEKNADFILLHHPLIFKPVKNVDASAYPGDLIARAIKTDTAIYAAHTSYDAAPGGVSVALADALGIEAPLRVVSPRGSLNKIVIFVPEENVEAVADALSGAGAGVVGDYTSCTFRTPGTGTFLPGDEANPYLGARGNLEKVPEIRIETVVPAHLAGAAVHAATESHPYEEMAHDVYSVTGKPEECGYGRVGDFPETFSPEELLGHVSEQLGFPARLVADAGKRIKKVAVLGGSGGSFIPEVAASGADAYITGDLDYHDALLAESLGLTAIDAGHAATELPALAPIANRLSKLVDVPVEVSRVRK